MTLTVRPVRRTPHADAWVRVVEALGGVVTGRDGDRVDLALGHGRVAVVRAGEPGAELGFEAPDLLTVAAECERNGLATVSAGGRLEVTGPDGLRLHVDEHPPAPPPVGPPPGADPALSTLPLWYTPDVAGAAGVLSRLGLTPRIASHQGDWVDFVAPGGGLVAAHGTDRPNVQVSFEYDGDVRPLAARLTGRGLTASVVDENYGLTLRVPDPDGTGDIYVNQVQTDLHGYRRAGT